MVFYLKEKKAIMISFMSVFTSLTIRVLINILVVAGPLEEAKDESYYNNTWFYPLENLFITIFCYYFPIGAVTFSLMYGIKHGNVLKK